MLDRKDVQEVGSKSTRGRQRPKGRKRLLQAVHHKLLFFASWANELSSDDLGSLANHCRERWREMEATLVAPRPGASGLAEAAFEGLNLSRGEASPPPAGSHTTIEEIPSGND